MAATHWMERNQPQQVAPSAASHAACKTTIDNGRKDSRGSKRFKSRLRPSPETITQTSAATGKSQLSRATTCGW